MTQCLAVFTTLDDRDTAQTLARAAITQRLAACVQIDKIDSVYRWDGAVQKDEEYRLLFKTTKTAYVGLEAFIRAKHPYDEPALWAVEMVDGSESFLAWIAQETDT